MKKKNFFGRYISTIKDTENKPHFIFHKAGETQKDTHQKQIQNKNLEKILSVPTQIKNSYIEKGGQN